MTLQLSQRAFTEALTFNASSDSSSGAPWAFPGASRLLEPVRDPAPRQVVGRQFDPDAITGQDPDEVHPELAADMCQHPMPVLELDREHRVRERLDHRSLHFDRVLLRHGRRVSLSQPNAGPGDRHTNAESIKLTRFR